MPEGVSGWPPPVLDPAGPFAAPVNTLSWVLFAMALTWAALRGRWQRLSGVLAVAALVVYVLFVLAVLTAD